MKTRHVRALYHAVTVCAIALAVAACSASPSGGGSYGAGDPNLVAPNPGGGSLDPFLADGKAVLRALDAIAFRSGTPLRVTSLDADRTNGLMVDVQEPKNHVNVDRYVVGLDGTLSGPTPAKMMKMGGSGPVTAADVDRQAFDPKAIAFARLTQTVREAIAKSTFADARVTEWEFSGVGPDDRKYIFFEAARGRPVAVVDANLKIVRMQF